MSAGLSLGNCILEKAFCATVASLCIDLNHLLIRQLVAAFLLRERIISFNLLVLNLLYG
jgi:hypothetical protein